MDEGTRKKKNVENSTFRGVSGPGHFPHFKKKSGVKNAFFAILSHFRPCFFQLNFFFQGSPL